MSDCSEKYRMNELPVEVPRMKKINEQGSND